MNYLLAGLPLSRLSQSLQRASVIVLVFYLSRAPRISEWLYRLIP